VDERDDDEADEGRDEKADPEIHDRFNHENDASSSPKPVYPTETMAWGL
jgi:hypothetical protein